MTRPINFVVCLLLLCTAFSATIQSQGASTKPEGHPALTPTEQQNLQTLTEFFEALNRHDADAMAQLMTDDFEFRVADFESRPADGPESFGRRIAGREVAREHFAKAFVKNPSLHLHKIELMVVGNKGWHLFSMTNADGQVVLMGVDLMTLRDGKIAVKDYYRKVPRKKE